MVQAVVHIGDVNAAISQRQMLDITDDRDVFEAEAPSTLASTRGASFGDVDCDDASASVREHLGIHAAAATDVGDGAPGKRRQVRNAAAKLLGQQPAVRLRRVMRARDLELFSDGAVVEARLLMLVCVLVIDLVVDVCHVESGRQQDRDAVANRVRGLARRTIKRIAVRAIEIAATGGASEQREQIVPSRRPSFRDAA